MKFQISDKEKWLMLKKKSKIVEVFHTSRVE